MNPVGVVGCMLNNGGAVGVGGRSLCSFLIDLKETVAANLIITEISCLAETIMSRTRKFVLFKHLKKETHLCSVKNSAFSSRVENREEETAGTGEERGDGRRWDERSLCV